jgi:mannosyltransferase OCH1-like enzyme
MQALQRLRRAFTRKIPPIIHYCWVGGHAPSDEMTRCIATWRAHHPEFEIRRWDESNVPADPFIDRALAGGHWSRASNAVRLHALYQHGGIYLDTDVEVLRSFEPLRRHSCFLGFQYIPDGTSYKPFEMCVASGVMGARPKHPFVRDMLTEIPRSIEGPAAFEILGPQMATAVLIRAGLRGYSDTPVTIGRATILPKDAFYPYFYGEPFDPTLITPATFSVHHWAKRW